MIPTTPSVVTLDIPGMFQSRNRETYDSNSQNGRRIRKG